MKVEQAISGKSINEGNANAAGAAAIEKAKPLPGDRNKWKIQLARTMVKRAILGCA
jgi:CO/xanthine dehydrogenase FAD-binding subunit